MNIRELKEKLNQVKVPESWYSLDEGLKPDAIILYKNYTIWECFYMSERGDRNDYRYFDREEDACEYVWREIEKELKYLDK